MLMRKGIVEILFYECVQFDMSIMYAKRNCIHEFGIFYWRKRLVGFLSDKHNKAIHR
jgi:hypothetical protein